MMIKYAGLYVLLATLTLSACDSQAQVNKYVPGQPMKYPIEAAATLRALGERYQVNCEGAPAKVVASCRSMIRTRSERCLGDVEAFDSEAQYKSTAREYLACVAPKPICKGVEVQSTDPDVLNAACDKSTD